MKREELLDQLHELQYTACCNQRYYQTRANTWECWDRAAKILVGVTTALGVITSAIAPYWASLTVSIISLIAAIVLNVLPFADWRQQLRDLFTKWTGLRKDIEALDTDVRSTAPDREIPEHFLVTLIRLKDSRHEIEADEPAPDMTTMQAAQDAENQSRYGKTDYQEILNGLQKDITEMRNSQLTA